MTPPGNMTLPRLYRDMRIDVKESGNEFDDNLEGVSVVDDKLLFCQLLMELLLSFLQQCLFNELIPSF